MEQGKQTKIWAHRGASAYAPENTLEAFSLAIAMHSDGIELDIHLTKDGEMVVSHDGAVDRMSHETGVIADLTLEELRKFDVCGNFGEKYPHVKIPTLGEVYQLMKPSGLMINVEIKDSGKAILEKAVALAKEMHMEDQIIYSCFNHFSLVELLAIHPAAFVAPLYGDNLVNPWIYGHSFGAKALHPHVGQIFALPGYIQKAHEWGIRVHPWTIDDRATIEAMISLGADAIITNRPDFALEILNEKR